MSGALRGMRRAWFRLRAHGIPVVYSQRYEAALWGVPLDPLRGEKVLAALDEAGLLQRNSLSEPQPVSVENLLRVHTAEYLAVGVDDVPPSIRALGACHERTHQFRESFTAPISTRMGTAAVSVHLCHLDGR